MAALVQSEAAQWRTQNSGANRGSQMANRPPITLVQFPTPYSALTMPHLLVLDLAITTAADSSQAIALASMFLQLFVVNKSGGLIYNQVGPSYCLIFQMLRTESCCVLATKPLLNTVYFT